LRMNRSPPLPTPIRLHPPPLYHHLFRLQKKLGSNGWLDPCFSMHEPLTYPSSLPSINSPRITYQSNPTQFDLTAAHRLLNYVSSHPNPYKTIHPSSMALWACTDASYLSRPKSGSVAGCSVGLGDPPHYLLHPPPESRRQSIREKQSLVRASRLIQSPPSHPPPSPTTHNAPFHVFCQWWLRLWPRRSMPQLLVVGKCWLSSRSP
jgi:hypothetical protein